MKSLRVTANVNGTLDITALPLPAELRNGTGDATAYRRQASGEEPINIRKYCTEPADFLRTITLEDGRFQNLATQAGALFMFVISGEITLLPDSASAVVLRPGDVFLVDGESAAAVALESRDCGRLVQLGVPAKWPGEGAIYLDEGTLNPRGKVAPNFKRVYTGEGGKAFFTEFPEIFSAPPGEWSAPRAVTGFRTLSWENGFVDYHPNVVNQMGIVMSGQLDLEVSGQEGHKEQLRPGDICLTEDITGIGHRNFGSGVMRVTTIVIPTEELWSWQKP